MVDHPTRKEPAFILACVVLLIAIVIVLASYQKDRPNIVLIVIDTLRADRLGAYGFPANTSPELDQFASGGVQFQTVIAQSSWTRPSIGSMLTSRYPRTLGIYKERSDTLSESYVTLAEILKQRGYRTLGFTANPNVNSIFNFDQGFDRYQDSTGIWKFMKGSEEPVARKFQPAAVIFDQVLKALEDPSNPNDEKTMPYYVQIIVMDVHEHGKMVREEFRNLFLENPDAPYLQAVRQVSADVASFYKKLKSIPGWKNTLLVITSDHGEGLRSHPNVPRSYLHGNILYESQVRVPLIFFNPGDGSLKSRKIVEPARLLDLMPTVLEYSGVSVPPSLQGRSLYPLMKGDRSTPYLPVVVESNWRNVKKIAVYTKDWRYIENRDNWQGVNPFELQPAGILENGKITDRIDSMRDVAEPLRKFLMEWERKNPKSKPHRQEKNLSDIEVEQLKSMGYLQ